MKSRLMKSISEITFSDSNDSDTKRENANIDGNTAMGTMLQYGSAVSKEFCMSQVMNPEHVMLHDQGDIHVHDMDFMNMGTLTCCQIDLSKRRKTCYKTYFLCKIFGRYIKKQYLCTVFFMVLDLRLSKGLGCREDNPSFFLYV